MRALTSAILSIVAMLPLPPAVAEDDALHVLQAAAIDWKPYPGVTGVEMAVLAGDPGAAGLYVIRARFQPGTFTRPHHHGEVRHITVLSGTWWGGHGATFAPESTMPIRAGGVVTHPAGMIHYHRARDEEVIVEITGIGPSSTHFVTPPAGR
jgi:quercetin dioxygenase-like cupin family protein